MELLGIGLPELLVILVLILIVVGPGRLPEMAAQLARFIRAFRRYSATVTREFNETLGDLEKEYEEIHGEWKEVGRGLDESARAVSDELALADKDAREAVDGAKSAAEAKPPVEEPSKPNSPAS